MSDDTDGGAPVDGGDIDDDAKPVDGGDIDDDAKPVDGGDIDDDAKPVDGGDIDDDGAPPANAGSGSGSGSGSSSDCDCTFCNADNAASVARGDSSTNGSASPDRSACLPEGPLQAFTISNLRPIAGKLLDQLSARTATLEFQPFIIAANLAGFVVGIGPGADLGVLHGWSGGGGIYFAPGNVVGYYGTWGEADGLFAGGDIGLSIVVIHGMDNFSGDGYAVGASFKAAIGGSLALTFNSKGDTLTGYCAAAGFGFSAGLFAQFSHTSVSPPS
jgi:hypothetical protein